MDQFWDKAGWALVMAAIAAVGWVGRVIIKPWSDAALARSKAFVDLVGVLEKSVPAIHAELTQLKDASKTSNDALRSNTEAAEKQTDVLQGQVAATKKWIEAIGSDPFKLCRATPTQDMVSLFRNELEKARGILLSEEEAEHILKRRMESKAVADIAKATQTDIPATK